jgi:hypothetical protein
VCTQVRYAACIGTRALLLAIKAVQPALLDGLLPHLVPPLCLNRCVLLCPALYCLVLPALYCLVLPALYCWPHLQPAIHTAPGP